MLFAKRLCVKGEELFRIYYYDCPPYKKSHTDLDGNCVDFSTDPAVKLMERTFEELKKKPDVAFRSGRLSFQGWSVPRQKTRKIIRKSKALTTKDLKPKFTQKTVDMKIGLDIAWLSSNRLVDSIVLATADSDFIPALKFARREGLRVVIGRVKCVTKKLRPDLLEHSDEIRESTYP